MQARKRSSCPLAASLTALALLCLPSRVQGGSGAAPASKLNVLLVTIDTLRADRVGAYGSERGLTPNLDALAARGAVFSRAFAHTPVTLPSHTNILLGTTPSYHGVHDNLNFVVRQEFVTLAEHLGGRGYATGAFVGGFPLVSFFGLDQGFSVYDDSFGGGEPGGREAHAKSGERTAGEVWTGARKWLRGRGSPWFLWVHFYDPHDPYAPPEPFRTRFARNPYDGEVAYTDSVLGDVLKEIRELGLDETTLVVCVSDHGESLGEHGEATHGYLAYNATIWVPFVIRVPGIPPRVVGQNVSHIDIFPTVCEALGIERPGPLQGRSLLPLMRGKKLPERPVYFESLSPYYNMGWAPLQGFVDKLSKFIDSPRPELYDLGRDFGETDDIAGEGDVGSLRKKLETIVSGQTSPEGALAGQASDRATREKLRSLGYVASLPGPKRTAFGPEDSVAALLPFHNRAAEAMGLYRAGKVAEGIGALREILTEKKNIGSAYLNLAAIYKEEKRPADAIAVLRLGLEAMPENYDIYYQHLSDLYESGRFDEVLEAFEAAGFPQVEFDPVVWNCVGLAHWKKGDIPKALTSFEKALAIDAGFAVTYHNLGTVHFDVYNKTRRPESFASARACFEKATTLDPAYGPAFHSLGVAYARAGEFARAVESLDRALALDPGLDEAHLFLGSAHLELGHRAEAYEHLTKYRSTPAFRLLPPAAKKKLEDLIASSKPGK